MQTKCITADAIIAEMKNEESEFQRKLKSAQVIVENLEKKYQAVKLAASKSNAEAEKLRSDCKKLKIERNSLKHKADGLTKEISRIYKNGLNVLDVEKMQQEIRALRRANSELQEEITIVRSQKRDALGELQATRLSHQQSVSYQFSVNRNDSVHALDQRDELERVVSEMTEYLHAKEMQIETLKQINETLNKEIIEGSQKK